MMTDNTAKVLIVDDEPSIREVLEIFFEQRGCQVRSCEDGERAVGALRQERFTLILTDLRLPLGGGMRVLDEAKRLQPSCPVVIMTAYASTATAIEAMKRGAYDYLTKPFELDALDVITQKALDHMGLVEENARLRARLSERRDARFMGLIGQSEPMREVFDLIERVAPSKTPILILGESGTGKEMVAQAIHQLSPRAEGPFIVMNCAAIPEQLFESELFGHVRGAFTGATGARQGLFQAADGGTLFLDEVGEMPLSMQAKVLRAIQFRRVKAVGGTEERSVDIRILAATNRSLAEDVQAGLFREDLYYRLNVIPLTLPPLRERSVDIPILVEHFTKELAQEQGRAVPTLEPEVMSHLISAPLLGNVRELKNLIERALALSQGSILTARDLMLEELRFKREPDVVSHEREPSGSSGSSGAAESPRGASRQSELVDLDARALFELLVERSMVAMDSAPEPPERGWDLEGHLELLEEVFMERALEHTQGHRTEAAKLLGISFRSIRYRLKKQAQRGADDPRS